MNPLLRSLVIVLGVPTFHALGYLLFGRYGPKVLVDSLLSGFLLTNILAYRRAAVDHIRDGMRDGSANIIVSIWLQAIALYGYFIWVIYVSNQTEEARAALRESIVGGTMDSLILVAVWIAILAPTNNQQPLVRIARTKLIVYSAIGAVFATVVAVLSFMHIVGSF